MENGKDAETLEEGFLELKLNQNEFLCGEVREDVSLGCLSDLNKKFVVDACSSRNELSNVDLARKFGNGSVEEFMFDGIAENNRMNEGPVNGYPDEKLSVSMHNSDFPVFEGELKFRGNDGDQIAKVEESVGKFDDDLHCNELLHDVKIEVPVEKGNDVLHPHEPGSPTKIEVSGNSINLFVEVFGPLDGMSDDNLDHPAECKLEESGSKQESSLEENGTLSTGVTDLSAKCEGEEDIIGEHECIFDIGDLVWLKTRTQLWWPGMVSDPSIAPNDMTKCEKKGSYLVKYYGSANFVWCGNADLKPFVEYFEQMSRQNNSRNFSGSVERAVCEIGLRVQLKMTCPCFSKDSQTLDAQWSLRNKEENIMSAVKASKVDVLSLSLFQPATFIADIRELARSIHVPSKVKLMVMKNRLSPFYRSIGHFELPLQLLRSGSDAAQNTQEHLKSDVRDGNHTNMFDKCSVEGHDRTRRKRKRKNHNDGSDHVLDDNLTSSAKGFESRERKKSRYLSYPYVDVIKGQEKEDLNQSSSLEGSCNGVDSRKKGTKKPFKERHIVSKADDISACSGKLLAELCSSALDCSYISRSKYTDSLKRFYSSFRVFAFLDADIATKVAEAEEHMEGSRVVKKSKKQKMNLASAKESVEENVVGDKSSVAGDQKLKESVIRKRGRKKKEQATNSEEQIMGIRVGKESENQIVNLLASGILENAHKFPQTENLQAKEKSIPAGLESVQNSPGIGTNIYPKSSWMISFHQACSNLFKSNKTPKKSVGVTPGLVETNSTPRLPDLNGNLPVDHIPVEGPLTNLVSPLPEQKKEGLVSPTINGVHHLDFASVSSSKDVPPTFQNTLLSNNGATGPYQCLNGDSTSRAVDPVTMNSFIQHSFLMGNFLSASKPEPKKRKRKEKTRTQVASGIPDLNGNVLDTSPFGAAAPEGSHIPPEGETLRKRRNKYESSESGGGNLVLNFAQGGLPSKETLVATFSRFGLLKESELEVLSDDSVKIVYERSSDARFAFRSLEKSHTFGESLVNFNLDCCMPEPPKINKKNNLQLQTFVPVAVAACKNRTKAGETPDIAFIKKNVEMMKSTLEKAGDKLSPETRAKLENEIKAFLDKISSVTGSGSS